MVNEGPAINNGILICYNVNCRQCLVLALDPKVDVPSSRVPCSPRRVSTRDSDTEVESAKGQTKRQAKAEGNDREFPCGPIVPRCVLTPNNRNDIERQTILRLNG